METETYTTTEKLKTACRVAIAVITAPIWFPFYLWLANALWREDEHD